MKTLEIKTKYAPKECEEVTASWKLDGYSWLNAKAAGVKVESPVLFEGCGLKAHLIFYPGGITQEIRDSGYNSLALDVDKSCDHYVYLNFRVVLVSQKEAVQSEVRTQQAFVVEEGGEVFDFIEFSTRQSMRDFLKDDTLTFSVTLKAWVEESVVTTSRSYPSSPTNTSLSKQLSADLGKLLAEGNHADVVLRVGDATLQAHRLILAARSPVFAQMFFGSGMRETKPNAEVLLDDFDLEVVKALLHSLYTGEIQQVFWQDSELLCHLLQAFHKYQVQLFIQECEEQISLCLSVENACERLMTADLLQLPILRSRVLSFLVSQPGKLAEVQATEGFQRLAEQRPKLVVEILAKVAPPCKRSRQSSEGDLPDNLEAMTVVQLKQLLSDRGLATAGTKAQLIGRLKASIRN